MTRLLVVTMSFVALAACSSASSKVLDAMPEGQVATEDGVREWLPWAGPADVWRQLRFQVPGVTGFYLRPFDDSTCPSVSVDGNTVTVTGGCTDEREQTWHGKYIHRYDAPGSTTGTMTFDGFGFDGSMRCVDGLEPVRARFDGTMTTSGELKRLVVDVDLTFEWLNWFSPLQHRFGEPECAAEPTTTAWDYSGTIDSTDETETVESGSGRIGVSSGGALYVETKDLRHNLDRCAHEPLSGTTLLRGGADTALVTFDGNADCDSPATANWSLNGQPQGELTWGL